MSNQRLFIKLTRESLPRIKDRYPFIYLERGRLEIDDSSIKWIDCDNNVVPIPVTTINALFLGPGTTVTHEAVKITASANCTLCWVGEDSLLFYSAGFLPTATSKNLKKQLSLSANPQQRLAVARTLFSYRFTDIDLDKLNLNEMMGLEGSRVRNLYQQKAQHYEIGWKGRQYIPGKFELSDLTNRILTASNAALYGIICAVIHSLGYSPHIGFIHSGSPLPFVYDLADIYKEYYCIDLAFSLTKELAGTYEKNIVLNQFRQRIIQNNLLEKIVKDTEAILQKK